MSFKIFYQFQVWQGTSNPKYLKQKGPLFSHFPRNLEKDVFKGWFSGSIRSLRSRLSPSFHPAVLTKMMMFPSWLQDSQSISKESHHHTENIPSLTPLLSWIGFHYLLGAPILPKKLPLGCGRLGQVTYPCCKGPLQSSPSMFPPV